MDMGIVYRASINSATCSYLIVIGLNHLFSFANEIKINMYDLDHVKKHLPHRDPFLLVDRVIEVDLGNKFMLSGT